MESFKSYSTLVGACHGLAVFSSSCSGFVSVPFVVVACVLFSLSFGSSERSYSITLYVCSGERRWGGCFLKDACCKHSNTHKKKHSQTSLVYFCGWQKMSKVCARQKMSNIASNKDVAFEIWNSFGNQSDAPGWIGQSFVYSFMSCDNWMYKCNGLCKFPDDFLFYLFFPCN